MPAGDYGKGTTLQPIIVNVTFDSDLRIDQVGIGYRIVFPSGKGHESGFTWHRPRTGEVAPDHHIEALENIMRALLAEAAAHEGVEVAPLDLRVGSIEFVELSP